MPALAVLVMVGAVVDARAQAIVSTGESFIEASLIPGVRQPDGTRLAGLRLSLAPGWKTYWRAPGEAGIPPEFDWSRSRNLGAATIHWPRPEVFESFGYQTVGYSEEVVLPISLAPSDPGAPMAVVLRLNLGVCKELCVLEEVEISADIAPDTAESGAALIEWAHAQVPLPAAEAGLVQAECRLSGIGRDRTLNVTLTFAETPIAPIVVFEGTAAAWITSGETRIDGDTIRSVGHVRFGDEGGWLDRSAVRMTVLADNFAADIQGCAGPAG